MLLVANLANYKMMQKNRKMTETLANRYSSESTQQDLSNGYQHDRVWMLFKDFCIFVLLTKIASALEGLRFSGTGMAIGCKQKRVGLSYVLQEGRQTGLLYTLNKPRYKQTCASSQTNPLTHPPPLPPQ